MKKSLLTAFVGLSTIGLAASSLPVSAATSDPLTPPVVTAGWFDAITDNVKKMLPFSPESNSASENNEPQQRFEMRKRDGDGTREGTGEARHRTGSRPGRGPVGTITAISGDTITITTLKGHTLTITVTPETTIMKAIKEPTRKMEEQTFADLALGEVIGIKPTVRPARDGQNTTERPTALTALRIVELPGLPPIRQEK